MQIDCTVRHIETGKTNACGDRNFGHTACIVYVDVCQRNVNRKLSWKSDCLTMLTLVKAVFSTLDYG